MTGFVISDVTVAETSTGVRLSARVRGGDGLPPSLWFEVPPAFAEALSARGDPFLPVILLQAIHRPGPIVIEADVSPELLTSARRVAALLATWAHPSGPAPGVPVEIAAPVAVATHRGRAAGAFFSGGVDSFYTVLRNIARYPAGDARLISHLVLLHGFDVSFQDAGWFERLSPRLRDAAETLGKTLLPLRTNLRAGLAGLDFELNHGAILAGSGLAVGGLFHTISIAASYPYAELRPWGTHPSLDPLWSSDRVEFVHDGAERSRPEKLGLIAKSPVALRALRVCFDNTEGGYNCGKCEKCVRTMLGLAIHGVLAQAAFPSRLEPDDVAQIFVPEYIRGRWRELCEGLRARDPEVVRAAELALARSARLDSTWSVLSRLGLTRERAQAIDRAILRGAGLALWRRLFWRE